MEEEINKLSLDDVFDLLTKKTMRYNQILTGNGPRDEFVTLRESIKILQRELEKRKAAGSRKEGAVE